MSEQFNRRASDKRSLDIEAMIAEEDDPKSRAMLIVLNNINMSLVANTDTVREVSTKLEQHLEHFEIHTKAEDALLNKGRGAWKVMAYVLGGAQLIAIAFVTNLRADLVELQAATIANKQASIRMEVRMDQLDKTSNVVELPRRKN